MSDNEIVKAMSHPPAISIYNFHISFAYQGTNGDLFLLTGSLSNQVLPYRLQFLDTELSDTPLRSTLSCNIVAMFLQ